jgi:Restriction Enzyme Adenine Methylase Associated
MGYSIEVDLEVFRKIWAERKSEAESDNEIIRRLLGMPAINNGGSSTPNGAASHGRPWAWKGVVLPPGTKLRMDYLGQRYEGEVRNDGKWLIGDRSFSTPSDAAKSLARTREGKRPSLDGWKYWYVKRPSDRDWILLDALRTPNGTVDESEDYL